MTEATRVDLTARIGARTLLRIPRRLMRIVPGLDDIIAATPPALAPLPVDAHGYLLVSLPEALAPTLAVRGLRTVVRQRYTRRYADLRGGFDAYLGAFSSKSRSTLLRKRRRFADGEPDVRCYRTVAEIEEFDRLARPLASRTYQERLLGAGLSDDLATMRALAAKDAVRAFILFRDGQPASYLYCPAHGDTLIYASLGYDPDQSALSPGTVLQLEAMRILMDDDRFARLDFTEGDGQHKALFATGGVACVDLLLLRPGIGNRVAADGIAAFDAVVGRLRGLATVPAFRPLTNAIRR